MKVVTHKIQKATRGNGDLVDITQKVAQAVNAAGCASGNATIFVVGSTASIITFEYEPGLIRDVNDLFDKLIPAQKSYAHDETWGDANGFSHLRAMLGGPSITVPFEHGALLLGTWQQIVLAEFDNRPRQRQVVVQIIGE